VERRSDPVKGHTNIVEKMMNRMKDFSMQEEEATITWSIEPQ